MIAKPAIGEAEAAAESEGEGDINTDQQDGPKPIRRFKFRGKPKQQTAFNTLDNSADAVDEKSAVVNENVAAVDQNTPANNKKLQVVKAEGNEAQGTADQTIVDANNNNDQPGVAAKNTPNQNADESQNQVAVIEKIVDQTAQNKLNQRTAAIQPIILQDTVGTQNNAGQNQVAGQNSVGQTLTAADEAVQRAVAIKLDSDKEALAAANNAAKGVLNPNGQTDGNAWTAAEGNCKLSSKFLKLVFWS